MKDAVSDALLYFCFKYGEVIVIANYMKDYSNVGNDEFQTECNQAFSMFESKPQTRDKFSFFATQTADNQRERFKTSQDNYFGFF